MECAPAEIADRVAILRTGPKLLVMDRVNGQSAYVSSSQEPLLRLIAVGESRLPAALQATRRQILQELAEQGIGTGAPPRFDTLNTVILKLTNACNYACAYCYDYEPEESATNLQLELAYSTLEQALELCTSGLQVIFHGGEPFLMFERIKKIVLAAEGMASQLGKRIVFCGQTNLSLLTEESVRFSIEHDIQWGFSLDGPASCNDSLRVMRNGEGTHVYFERALSRFPDFVRNCSAMATITSANCDKLMALSRYFHGHGLRGWDWSLFQPIGRGRDQLDMDFAAESLVASWNELFDAVVEGEFDGFTVSPVTKYIENFLVGPGRNMCMRQECGAARNLLSISADGRIEACDCIDPKGPLSNLGDIHLVSLAEARNSETAQRIRSRNVQQGKCGRCIWLAVCGGTCMARAHSLHGIHENECQVALNAFDRIARHLAESPRLRDYLESCYGGRPAS